MTTRLCNEWALVGALVIAAALFPLGCETEASGPSTGSESHFLKSCESDAECGKLSCFCGVCSRACDADETCAELDAAAECVTSATRPTESACATPPEAICDLRCETNADCSSLGREAECANGFCRDAVDGGAGGPGGSGGSGGSGGGTSDTGGGGATADILEDGQVELDELCAMYQDSVCKKEVGCSADTGFCDEAHCRDAVGCGELDALRGSIDRNYIDYDPVAAAECYASLLADPCQFSYELIVIGMPGLRTLLNACPGALLPAQSLGDPCYAEEECVFGTSCDHETACPGTCVVDDPPKGVEGDVCATVFGPEQDCIQPLVCLLPASTESGEQECGIAPIAGDPCENASQCRCNGPEALCQTLGCDLSLGECVPLSEVGEPCSTLDATGVPDCLAPAWCDGGFDGGICQPPSAAGEPCSIFTDCQAPFTCIDAVCVPAVGPGETCTFGGDCIRGDCVDDVCAPLAGTGEACEADVDCAIGSICFDGACQPFSCPAEACSDEAPCLEGRCESGSCVPWPHVGDPCDSDADCLAAPISSGLICADGVCARASQCW